MRMFFGRGISVVLHKHRLRNTTRLIRKGLMRKHWLSTWWGLFWTHYQQDEQLRWHITHRNDHKTTGLMSTCLREVSRRGQKKSAVGKNVDAPSQTGLLQEERSEDSHIHVVGNEEIKFGIIAWGSVANAKSMETTRHHASLLTATGENYTMSRERIEPGYRLWVFAVQTQLQPQSITCGRGQPQLFSHVNAFDRPKFGP